MNSRNFPELEKLWEYEKSLCLQKYSWNWKSSWARKKFTNFNKRSWIERSSWTCFFHDFEKVPEFRKVCELEKCLWLRINNKKGEIKGEGKLTKNLK